MLKKKKKIRTDAPTAEAGDDVFAYSRKMRDERTSSKFDKDAWDKLVPGKNVRRFLPARKKGTHWLVHVWQHFRVGPEGKGVVRCIDPEGLRGGRPQQGTKCPLCEMFVTQLAKANKVHGRDSVDGKEAYMRIQAKWKPTYRAMANVRTPDGEVKILGMGVMIVEALENFSAGEESIGAFQSVSAGQSIIIQRRGEGRMTKYEVRPSHRVVELEDWSEIKDKLHDLEKAAGSILTPDAIRALMAGDDAEDADDEDDDEDEVKPKKKKKKTSKAVEDDDDDDTEEDDEDDEASDADDDDDEGEEEDAPPPRKKRKGN
jgi:hypothetical protein